MFCSNMQAPPLNSRYAKNEICNFFFIRLLVGFNNSFFIVCKQIGALQCNFFHSVGQFCFEIMRKTTNTAKCTEQNIYYLDPRFYSSRCRA